LHVNHKALEFIGHRGLFVSKAGDDLLYSMFGTLNAGKPNMDESRHLADIQMPKFPLLCMVIHRTQLLTLRARKGKISRMLNVDINTLLLFIENHFRDKPGASDTEDLGEKGGLLHKDMGLNGNEYLTPGPEVSSEFKSSKDQNR
jgi:hypothetical protein